MLVTGREPITARKAGKKPSALKTKQPSYAQQTEGVSEPKRKDIKRMRKDIIVDILLAALYSERKSRIIYKMKLPYKVTDDYLRQLIELGLIKAEGPNFKTTMKGIRFLRAYHPR